MIPLFHPFVPDDAIGEVTETLRSRWVGQGIKVDKFEQEFERKFNQRNCVSLSSGSAALETAYELVGISAGDEVICTPLTCTATNIPLLRLGAKIVWADINPHTLCMDKNDVLRKITTKTKAIVNVHLGGIDNNLGKMPVPVVSDACQALGVFNGDFTANSFQAIKHITTGDGGMLCCPDDRTKKLAKLTRWFGIDREKKRDCGWQAYKQREMTFDIEVLGYKRQMTDIAAGMGLAGLRSYDRVIDHYDRLFRLYKDGLKDVKDIRVIDGENNKHWLCTVVVKRRDDFAKMLKEAQVETNLVQIRNDIFAVFGGKRAYGLSVMDDVETRYLSLPLNMKVTEGNVNYIINTIKGGW